MLLSFSFKLIFTNLRNGQQILSCWFIPWNTIQYCFSYDWISLSDIVNTIGKFMVGIKKNKKTGPWQALTSRADLSSSIPES